MTITDSIAIGSSGVLSTGVRGSIWIVFGGEIGAMLLDMRWAIFLITVLIIADFYYGWSESKKRYLHAKKKKDELRTEMYRWHKSRALRRTCNKLADYVVMMLVAGGVGMAILEPLNVSHTWGAWAGVLIACYCELTSIMGHFLYLHGIEVKKKTIVGLVKAFAVAWIKRKDSDTGEAVEEALEKAEEIEKS